MSYYKTVNQMFQYEQVICTFKAINKVIENFLSWQLKGEHFKNIFSHWIIFTLKL